MVLVFVLVSIGLNLLKPWPLALLVDNVLGKMQYPGWTPGVLKKLNPLTQITAIALTLLAISFMGSSGTRVGEFSL